MKVLSNAQRQEGYFSGWVGFKVFVKATRIEDLYAFGRPPKSSFHYHSSFVPCRFQGSKYVRPRCEVCSLYEACSDVSKYFGLATRVVTWTSER